MSDRERIIEKLRQDSGNTATIYYELDGSIRVAAQRGVLGLLWKLEHDND